MWGTPDFTRADSEELPSATFFWVLLLFGFKSLTSPAELCKIQDSVCILSYNHDILHKGAFGCALSYLSKINDFFSIWLSNSRWPPSTVLKIKTTLIHACTNN